MGLGVGLML